MAYSNEQLNSIYDRTDGRCHVCSKKLAFGNYGRPGTRAAWEVEHSRPRARGGSDTPGNRYAACVTCNRSKGIRSSRAARAENGLTSAPLSRDKRRALRSRGKFIGAGIGAFVGHRAAGPWGALLLGLAGAELGRDLATE